MRSSVSVALKFSSLSMVLFLACEQADHENEAMNDNRIHYPVYDIDGNGYDTVRIGTQIWTVQNLRSTHFRNGDSIPGGHTAQQLSLLLTPARILYKGDSAHFREYGFLYNWYAVADTRGLAPQGWHIPSNEEWTVLSEYLGGDSVAGGKLKAAGTDSWAAPNTGASNESGFSALPAGWFSGYGAFYNSEGTWASFYSSSSHDFGNCYSWGIYWNRISLDHGIYYKQAGRSIRCIKD